MENCRSKPKIACYDSLELCNKEERQNRELVQEVFAQSSQVVFANS